MGRRIAELTALYTAPWTAEELTPRRLMLIREAAELKAAAEQARGNFLRGDRRESLDNIVRVERKADLAVKALALPPEGKPRGPTLADVLMGRAKSLGPAP